MPKGYWIVHIDVRDPEIYQQYVKANATAFAKYGARFLVRGGKHVVTSGKAPDAFARDQGTARQLLQRTASSRRPRTFRFAAWTRHS